MSNTIIIANWKDRLSVDKGMAWLDTFATKQVSLNGVKVVVAPSFVSLAALKKEAGSSSSANVSHLQWGVQDLSQFPAGGYTGVISAALVKTLVKYAILGHPDRRRYFHETAQEVSNKAAEAVEAGIIPVICMDRENASKQVGALSDDVLEEMISVYTPAVSGQGETTPESGEDVAGAAKMIAGLTGNRPVLYGGGVRQANVQLYAELPELAGVMVGEASLDADEFASIVRAISSAK